MAVKIVRKRRKNANGGYDIVHYETQAKAVWMSDGRSVEEAVTAGGGGSGGADVLVVTGEEDSTNHTVLNPSHTFAEIKAAHDAGKTVELLLSFVYDGETYYDRLEISYYLDDVFQFGAITGGYVTYAGVNSQNEWQYKYYNAVFVDEETYGPIFAGSQNDAQRPDVYLLRNSRFSSTDRTPTVNGEICWTYG